MTELALPTPYMEYVTTPKESPDLLRELVRSESYAMTLQFFGPRVFLEVESSSSKYTVRRRFFNDHGGEVSVFWLRDQVRRGQVDSLHRFFHQHPGRAVMECVVLDDGALVPIDLVDYDVPTGLPFDINKSTYRERMTLLHHLTYQSQILPPLVMESKELKLAFYDFALIKGADGVRFRRLDGTYSTDQHIFRFPFAGAFSSPPRLDTPRKD